MSIFTIYYGTQSDIRVKSYCHFNFLRASVFNYERLDILRDSKWHPSKKLLSLEFARSFCFQFWASRYIRALNRTSELKVIIVWICYELLFSIMRVSIYYGAQSNIRIKCYCRLNLLQASIFNNECLDILRDTIGHLSKNLLRFEFATSFHFQLQASRYIMGHNQTSE